MCVCVCVGGGWVGGWGGVKVWWFGGLVATSASPPPSSAWLLPSSPSFLPHAVFALLPPLPEWGRYRGEGWGWGWGGVWWRVAPSPRLARPPGGWAPSYSPLVVVFLPDCLRLSLPLCGGGRLGSLPTVLMLVARGAPVSELETSNMLGTGFLGGWSLERLTNTFTLPGGALRGDIFFTGTFIFVTDLGAIFFNTLVFIGRLLLFTKVFVRTGIARGFVSSSLLSLEESISPPSSSSRRPSLFINNKDRKMSNEISSALLLG